jgi:hypothetical protein
MVYLGANYTMFSGPEHPYSRAEEVPADLILSVKTYYILKIYQVYLCSGSRQQNENDMTTNKTIFMKYCLQLILCLCNPHFLVIDCDL